MTCKQLAGACDLQFHAETFDEMAKLSQDHGTEMFNKHDAPHLTAMEEMRKLMGDPNAMQKWMDENENLMRYQRQIALGKNTRTYYTRFS